MTFPRKYLCDDPARTKTMNPKTMENKYLFKDKMTYLLPAADGFYGPEMKVR